MAEPTNCLEFENSSQWMSWLEINHTTETEAWLIIYKKKYQDHGLALDAAVEAALCFGWIDGSLRKVDQKRFALRFSPRNPNSVWSIRNIQRVERLISEGKMTDSGMAKIAEAKGNGQWQAAIRREALVHPTASSVIQNECGACHMPMHRFQANAEGRHGEVFAHLPLAAALTDQSVMAADGVSCTVCHQIGAAKLGRPESFTAGFELDVSTPSGERKVYGPFDVDAGRQSVMRSVSHFVPVKEAHIQTSEVCATCHTLITHALDDDGNVVGELPEQVPYLEWKHSSFRDVQSCQSCHMPVVEEPMAVSSVVGLPREGVSKHVFRGGNLLMPRIFNAHRQELAVQALPQELETTTRQTVQNLTSAAGTIEITRAGVESGTLLAEIAITNLAGHKLPSAYPSRRVWIHLTVRDRDDGVVFESGRFNPDGSVEGNDNDVDPGRFEPHYEVISRPGQVQIYEPILADPSGAVTTVLLSALSYAKDNRLLPDGFDKATAEEFIAVHGAAAGDGDFIGGGDRIAYEVEIEGDGPFAVSAELWYQPVGYRWAHNLGDQQADEIERFIGYYREFASSSAVVIADDSVLVE
jgi:nitrate/TMAO reductase-like tetraheme cytochrome c subunit